MRSRYAGPEPKNESLQQRQTVVQRLTQLAQSTQQQQRAVTSRPGGILISKDSDQDRDQRDLTTKIGLHVVIQFSALQQVLSFKGRKKSSNEWIKSG